MADVPALRRPARLDEVQQFTALLRQCCAAAAVPPDLVIDLELALAEAANNVVLHGYQGRDDGDIEMIVRPARDAIEIELRDRGIPIPEARLADISTPSLDAESGRGMGIIRSCTDRIEYHSDQGVNRLILVKRMDP